MCSEVAALRRKIELLSQAMYHGLHGYAEVSKHEIITKRYDQIGKYQKQLAAYVGTEQAFIEVVAVMVSNETMTTTNP